MFFEVKIKRLEETLEKDISEVYLFDAVNWTEAEKRTFETMEDLSFKNFKIQSIKKANLVEVFAYDSGEYWFKIGAEMIVIDEDTRKESKVKENYLLMADDIQQALTRIKESVDYSVAPYVVLSVAFANITEVYPYNKDIQIQTVKNYTN
jgi:hypothetical protein